MATYKDDLDILKAAEKADTNKLTFNAITELDNKGLLSRYGNEGGGGGGIDFDVLVQVDMMTQIESEAITTIIGDYETFKEKFEQNDPKYTVGAIVPADGRTFTVIFTAITIVNRGTENEYIKFLLIIEDDTYVAWYPDGTWSFVSDSSDSQSNSQS